MSYSEETHRLVDGCAIIVMIFCGIVFVFGVIGVIWEVLG